MWGLPEQKQHVCRKKESWVQQDWRCPAGCVKLRSPTLPHLMSRCPTSCPKTLPARSDQAQSQLRCDAEKTAKLTASPGPPVKCRAAAVPAQHASCVCKDRRSEQRPGRAKVAPLDAPSETACCLHIMHRFGFQLSNQPLSPLPSCSPTPCNADSDPPTCAAAGSLRPSTARQLYSQAQVSNDSRMV